MTLNDQTQVPITEAEQDFSKVARLVDKNGSVVILKNNKPRYIIMEYSDVEALTNATDEDVQAASRLLIEKNIEAYKELAK